MTFKPFGKKYNFNNTALIKEFPSFLRGPIESWLWSLLSKASVVGTTGERIFRGERYVKAQFKLELQIDFREEFPSSWNQFYNYLYSDVDRLTNFLAFCLQKFAVQKDAQSLESILSQSGSGYSVLKTEKDAYEYTKGAYDLVERVEEIVIHQAINALTHSEILMEAWTHCYSIKPDYTRVVIECQNFLEQFLKNQYSPKESKPQLGKLIGMLKSSKGKLKYKGDTVLTNSLDLLNLIDNVPQFRGMHMAGTGKKPNKSEAEYVLHTTIYIWNLHQGN